MDTTEKIPNMIPTFSEGKRELQESTWYQRRVPANRRKRGNAQWINTCSLNEPITYKLLAICTSRVAFRLLEFSYPHEDYI